MSKNENRLKEITAELQSLFIEFKNLYKDSFEKINEMTEELDKMKIGRRLESKEAEKTTDYITGSNMGRLVNAEALYWAVWHMKKQRYADTSHWKAKIQEIEHILNSDLYRDCVEENEKEWRRGLTE